MNSASNQDNRSPIHVKSTLGRAMVMTQLVEQSLQAPEVGSSNPVIRELLYRTFVYCQLY